MQRIAARKRKPNEKHIFINCPFDHTYRPILDALVFVIFDAGFVPRSALEFDDGTEIRLNKILRLIGQCKYGIHDISYTKLDPSSGLRKFNMPFELGVFFGCKVFGNAPHQTKIGLILDEERYRYQKFLSDLAGQISEPTPMTHNLQSERCENGYALLRDEKEYQDQKRFGVDTIDFKKRSLRYAE